MPNPLVPTISSNQVSMSSMLRNPTKINDVIAMIASELLIIDAFFRPTGGNIQGGGILYDVLLNGGNFSLRDVEPRAPGAEYIITHNDVKHDMATPQDWGAKIFYLDEEMTRYDTTVLGNRIVTLANTLVRKIDQLAIAAIEAALAKYSIASVPGHDWGDLVTVGPADDITPNSARPVADIANAGLLVRVEDLGIKAPDTLVLHPQQQMALQVGYGAELTSVLAGLGITKVRTSTQVANGTAYVVSSGQAGVLGFEKPLTTEVIPDREHRRTWVQSYAMPAFAVPTPGAVRKITGLAG